MLLQGDCLELMKDIKSGSIDMILCDLPYGTTACKWDVIIPFQPLWEHYERIIKPNGVISLTGAEPFTSLLIISNLKLFKYDLIWRKNNPTGHLNSKKAPLRYHENICIFYKKPPVYNPQKTQGHERKVTKSKINHKADSVYGSQNHIRNYDSTERYPESVLLFAGTNKLKNDHPTQKPVPLFEYLIRTYTNPGDTVLDNCSGSGTTAIACINTGRKFICMEKDETYYKKCVERIENHYVAFASGIL